LSKSINKDYGILTLIFQAVSFYKFANFPFFVGTTIVVRLPIILRFSKF